MSLFRISKSALAVFLAVCSGTTVNAACTSPFAASNAASGGAAPSGLPSGNSSSGKVATTYFAGYHAERKDHPFPVSSMQWDKFTDVKYAFAEPAADGSLNLTKSAPDQLPIFVREAHKHNVKASVAIGGWAGSIYFSNAVATPQNRTAFVKTCLDLVKKYNLDGLDFDWEYPNRQGLGCNTISPNDTGNFVLFLQELRKAQPKPLLLTAAVSIFPYNDASGKQSSNGALAPLADVLDYVVVMGYDLFGAWASTGGPNAPLRQSCDPKRNNQGGIAEGVAKWIQAGFPARKMALGVAAYGHGFSVTPQNAFQSPGVLNAYPPQNSSNRLQGGSWDDDPAIDECGNPQPHGGTYTFWSMIQQGKFLDESGNPRQGITYGFNNCSMTPFVYDQSKQVWVSYDNVRSLNAKGKYIQATKMAGFAMWEAGGDYNNIIVNAIRSAVGFSA